jgi:hypothetical protein
MSLPLPSNATDLRGRTFGRLKVREFAEIRGGYAYWKCDCECGATDYLVRGKNLIAAEKAGRAISCGCYRADSTVRLAARLKITQEERKAAAGGKKVRAEKPAPKPRPKPAKRILPLLPEPATLPPTPPHATPTRSAPPPTPTTPPERPATVTVAPHSFWVAVTKDRHRGYHVSIRLGRASNTPMMQSRRLDSPSEARREARRIFGERLNWITGDQAGLQGQPWVLEIAEVGDTSDAARTLNRARKNPAGGRPRSDAGRCPCAAMTLRRAEARGKSAEHDPGCPFFRERAIIV